MFDKRANLKYSRLNLEYYTTDSKTFLEIDLTFLISLFISYFNQLYKFGNRHFWAKGYYVSTVGLNEATIKKCIQD